MTPTTLAEELHAIECNIHPTVMGALRPRWQCEVRAAALLALPPDRRAELAVELLDVETLEVRLWGLDFDPPDVHRLAAAILAALKGA